MFSLTENHPLFLHNTFGITASARYFLTLESAADWVEFCSLYPELAQLPSKLIVGGGSNLLFVNDFDGLVILPQMKGIEVTGQTETTIDIEAGAGVVWDNFVAWCVENGWGGVENLSLIPGTVGASPVQNIGAYGVEAESVISEVYGIDLQTLSLLRFTKADCLFGYRDSIFKQSMLNRFLVTSVVFRLQKIPQFNLGYGALKTEADKFGEVSLSNIRRAVISTRESKLPDPAQCGNAGSFFKNPCVSQQQAATLLELYPAMPHYPQADGSVKLAAGWLIEQTGLKGYRQGQAGVHDKQALVLVNLGGARAEEILALASHVQQCVAQKFRVALEPEVRFIGERGEIFLPGVVT